MRTSSKLIVPLLGLLACTLGYAGSVQHVDITRLVASPDTFLGKHVAFHGCLINTFQHGEFVEPCDSLGHGKIILVTDDTFGIDGPHQALFKKRRQDSSLRCVQANFSGVLVTTMLTWPNKRQQTTIKLTAFDKVSPCPA